MRYNSLMLVVIEVMHNTAREWTKPSILNTRLIFKFVQIQGDQIEGGLGWLSLFGKVHSWPWNNIFRLILACLILTIFIFSQLWLSFFKSIFLKDMKRFPVENGHNLKDAGSTQISGAKNTSTVWAFYQFLATYMNFEFPCAHSIVQEDLIEGNCHAISDEALTAFTFRIQTWKSTNHCYCLYFPSGSSTFVSQDQRIKKKLSFPKRLMRYLWVIYFSANKT